VAIGRRKEKDGEAYSADFLELFFDLVFVFAVTQISHLLLDDLTWAGAGKSAVMLLAVWWAWNYTTWVTNELDVNTVSVRLLMLALMLAGLVMAVGIPYAFEDRALLFALAYVAIQVGRTAFLAYAASDRGTPERHRSVNILIWFLVSTVFWIGGALLDGEARVAMWVIALLIDYAAPLFIYRVPGRTPLPTDSWDLGTEHFTERFGLFVIIALGETVILTGATASDLDIDVSVMLALTIAFVTTAAIWWLYFSEIAGRAAKAMAAADNPVLIARDAFTYGHALIIAGIIVAAVGDEIVIAHPGDPLKTAYLVTVVAGPVIFLLAQVALGWRMTGRISVRRMVAVAACLGVGLLGLAELDAIFVSGLLAAVLISLAIADHRSFSRDAETASGTA
jgi:low temperature requirement protein LtrA